MVYSNDCIQVIFIIILVTYDFSTILTSNLIGSIIITITSDWVSVTIMVTKLFYVRSNDSLIQIYHYFNFLDCNCYYGNYGANSTIVD